MFPKKKCFSTNEEEAKQSKKVYFDPKIALHSLHLSKLQQSLQLNFKELFGCGQHFWHSKEGSVEKNRVLIRCTLGLTCIIINGLTDLSSDNPQSQVQWSFLLLLGYQHERSFPSQLGSKGSLFCCFAIITTHYNYNTEGLRYPSWNFLVQSSHNFTLQARLQIRALDSDLNSTGKFLFHSSFVFYIPLRLLYSANHSPLSQKLKGFFALNTVSLFFLVCM